MQFPRLPAAHSSASPSFTRRPSVPERSESPNYIGIDHLKQQATTRALRRGFTFNLMLVGKSGLGKSTLVNSLFKTTVSNQKEESLNDDQCHTTEAIKTTKIVSKTNKLNENGVKLTLTVVDTPGFGDKIDNTNCWNPIIDYINEQYEEFFNEEQKVDRPPCISDTRIHCVLYFIQPSGHSLTSLDIEVLKRIGEIVNVIPVIAKADGLTAEEKKSFKAQIKADLADHGIKIYPNEAHEDENDAEANNIIREYIPFAVVGSTIWNETRGKKILSRKSKWGIVELENKNHSDFPVLRDILIRTNMADLVEITSLIHFEIFRKNKILNKKETTEE